MSVSRGATVRRWPLWELPRGLIAFITVTVTLYLAALATAGATETVSVRDGLMFAVLAGCVAGTVELTRRSGTSSGLANDVFGIWLLPAAILLPPVCALAICIAPAALGQWRVRRLVPHRRVFSASATGLSYGAASVIFHMLARTGLTITHPLPWAGAAVLAATVQWAIGITLVGAAVTAADPGNKFRQVVLTAEALRADLTELSIAVLVVAAAGVTPLFIGLAFPIVTLAQRATRHEQLAAEARHDHKTGLLNAGAWEREAVTEIARAVRQGEPLAVAMIDLDHFKKINDTYGHLAGDKALKTIADALKNCVREYDLVGRWGGEEFVILLSSATPVISYAIAERIREHIAQLPLDVGPITTMEPVLATVSVGVAALGNAWNTTAGSTMPDFLAAADMAVYQAKKNGRDQVCVITENAVFGTSTQREFTPPTGL